MIKRLHNLDEILDGLEPARRARLEREAAEVSAEVDALRELRRACGETQTEIAAKLHMTQAEISRMEGRPDIFLSTLRRYVEGLGGSLDVRVELHGRAFSLLSINPEAEEIAEPILRPKRQTRLKKAS
ncbi:MAG TPA: helix-turn-helix domain-containing protein [Candidatus Baltobacteraceae bacterium]|jgi:transcriptional regulator with XRE-family HTH domain|nr:helix-turn-helix domain-containing protein [Candidatus Baltobacteraceae bacterium]